MGKCEEIPDKVIIMHSVPLGTPVIKVYDIIGDDNEMERISHLVGKGKGGIICVGYSDKLNWARPYVSTIYSTIDDVPTICVGDYIIDINGSMYRIIGYKDNDAILQLGGVYQE